MNNINIACHLPCNVIYVELRPHSEGYIFFINMSAKVKEPLKADILGIHLKNVVKMFSFFCL